MSQSERINLLLVDDQPSNLVALNAMLEDPGYRIIQARSGQEALRWLLKEDFALVLLDVQMPVMDGFETAAMIRSRERSAHTPIIFVTAFSTNDNHVSRGYSMGAVDYIFKPVVAEVLRAKVQVFADLFRKTRQLRRANEELRASEEKYRSLFSQAGEAIVVSDARTDEVLDANEAALALYGYARLELVGLRFAELVQDAGRHRRRDGSVFPAESKSSTSLLQGRLARVSLVRDLTEKLKAVEAQRLEDQVRLQRDFVANVSHELRTPIAAVRGFAETLLRGGMDDVKHRVQFVRAILRNAARLGALVEDLLNLAAHESGKARAQPRTIALGPFVERYVHTIAPLAERRKVSIKIEITPETKVRADRKHLGQILQNLIDNAIKYNKPGGFVEVVGRPQGAHAQVSVRDTGMGIPAEELPNLFTRFHRSDQARDMPVGGTGLGLYLVKSIVESNGGSIWAESQRDRGSTFHFTVPLAQS